MTEANSEVGQCTKGFVVDTSVLLHDPEAISTLAKDPENFVVVPLGVLEELDQAKRDSGEKGFNARQIARMLDDLRQDGQRSLKSGVRIGPNRGIVIVDHDGNGIKDLSPDLEDSNDNKVLVIARKWQVSKTERPITIVTKDINMRLKADALGIPANDYRQDKAVRNVQDMYSGWQELEVDDPSGKNALAELPQKKEISADRLAKSVDLSSLFPNQCCQISWDGKYLLAVYKKKAGVFRHILKPAKFEGKGSVKPINDRQIALYHLLCDPDIPLVTVRGRAGTGKSLITFAAGHEQFVKDRYPFFLIYKPIIEVGERTLGLLPGDLQEKMAPWESAIYDSFHLILTESRPRREDVDGDRRSARSIIEDHLQTGKMEISPISHVRGRSLNGAYIVVDEAQNLTPHEAKTLITRVGKGSKIVLVGDIEQIDSLYLDPTSNGLSRTVECLKNHELAAHITLTQGERSELAELAASLM